MLLVHKVGHQTTHRRYRSLERTILNDGAREAAAALGLLLPGPGGGVPGGGRLGLGGHSARMTVIAPTAAAGEAVAAHGSHPAAVADDDLGGRGG